MSEKEKNQAHCQVQDADANGGPSGMRRDWKTSDQMLLAGLMEQEG